MRAFIGILLSFLSVSSLANKVMDINVNGTGSTFSITLPANPTTGYQWTIQSYDSKLFYLKISQYIKPTSQLIGAGGHMLYRFSLLKGQTLPKYTTMIFKYARSWETQSGQLTTVNVHFSSANLKK